MTVLSLFDGMSCGQAALREAGVSYTSYYASEIDKDAIKVTQGNFPGTIQVGDVTKLKYRNGTLFTENGNFNVGQIDMIMGGSPCQGFSVNGRKLNFLDPRSRLFFEFNRLLDETACQHWLFENVATMSAEIKTLIDEYLGVKGEYVNSSTASAQNRKRFYWASWPFNIPVFNSMAVVADVLEDNFSPKLLWPVQKISKQKFSAPKSVEDGVTCINPRHPSGIQNYQQDRIYDAGGKFVALAATIGNRFNIIHNGIIRRLSIREQARLQTIPEWYCFDYISDQAASRCIGNGWTVKVVANILSQLNIVQPEKSKPKEHSAFKNNFQKA